MCEQQVPVLYIIALCLSYLALRDVGNNDDDTEPSAGKLVWQQVQYIYGIYHWRP